MDTPSRGRMTTWRSIQKASRPRGKSQSIIYSKELAPRAKSNPNPAPRPTATIGLQVMPQVEPTAAPRRLYPKPTSAPSSVHRNWRDKSKLFITVQFQESGNASGPNNLYAPRPDRVPVKDGHRDWSSALNSCYQTVACSHEFGSWIGS